MARNASLLIGLALSALLVGIQGGSYLITVPSKVQPGSPYDISVAILNTTENVDVEATLQDWRWNGTIRDYDVIPVYSVSGTFTKDQVGTLSMAIDPEVICQSCRINIRGTGALQFERSEHTSVSRDTVAIMVQTDKAIYKPSQVVNFRVFAIYPDMMMYSGLFTVYVRDPNNNNIKLVSNATSQNGVFEDNFVLSDQPEFGAWSIHVELQESSDRYTQTFEVADYELPRFEVKVNLPPYGLDNMASLTGSVEATYTFGQPVIGRVELHFGPNRGPDSCGVEPKTTQISFQIDGKADFNVPLEDIRRAVGIYDRSDVKVTAFVIEEATGVRLNGSEVLTFYTSESRVQFLENTPSVFKPGLPYTAFIQVTTPDGKSPPPSPRKHLSVYTTVTYQSQRPDQSLYSTNTFTGTYPLPGQNVTLPADGVVPFTMEIPNNATKITIKATYNGVSQTQNVDNTFSRSNNFIQITLLDKNIKADSVIKVRVDGTEDLNDLTYEVLARGSKVDVGVVDAGNNKSVTFDLRINSNMAPTAHLLVFYSRDSDEVVADSLAFNVDGLFMNQVSIEFSQNRSEPAEPVDVLLTADPNSQVNVLAVDQSVLLLKSGNDISTEKVSDAVSKFDTGRGKPSDSEYALSYSAESAREVFQSTGLLVITDVNIEGKPRTYGKVKKFGPSDHDDLVLGKEGIILAETTSPNQGLAEVTRIRQIFPETWLWSSKVISCSSGKATISTTVPDTITSWIASAFATNLETGLGVAPSTTKLTVFRKFFVSLTFPSAMTRGEQAVIQATVFNYLPTDANVEVKLKGSSQFKSVQVQRDGTETFLDGDQTKTIQVKADKQGVVFFPIQSFDIGLMDIEVTARSAQAADGVRRQITVEAEGAPVSFNNPLFVNLDGSNTLMEPINFSLPPSAVAGSEKTRVKVTGDLIGSSLHNLASLLELPMGCGEQSMAKFAPDLYIAQYLTATGQLTGDLRHRITYLLETGYQRQLTYLRYDSSFSAFGNRDETGSTWLTAQVARVFSEARHFIYIDPQVIYRAVDWLVDRQHGSGRFPEFGKVLDVNTQGSGKSISLTAYVLLTLNEVIESADSTLDEYRRERWTMAARNATSRLEKVLKKNTISDPVTMAMVSYALVKSGSRQAEAALRALDAFSTTEGNLKYWSIENKKQTRFSSKYLIWNPPHVQARPTDILATSYAILALSSYPESKIGDILPSVTWLASQRNAQGGFASTQDTTVGLQALSSFASLSDSRSTDLEISITSGNGDHNLNFIVNASNSLTLQIQELSQVPATANVHGTGVGFAMVEFESRFHVSDELTTPSFDVSTVLLDDDLDSFNLMVCTRWLWDRETGMVVQEVSIPSGFQPDLTSLGQVAGLMRSERKGDKVAIYFDKVSKTSLCYSILMTRASKVAKTQPSFVRTFDYYQPSDQSTVFYHPRKLKEATVCDVCDECCVRT